MIFSVAVSIVSLIFGVYKNIEAGNARGFAYEQAYRVMSVVQDANIGPATKASILEASLAVLGTPPPVVDLSRSSADAPADPDACPAALAASCIELAGDLARLNALCVRTGPGTDACLAADVRKEDIDAESCITCFAQ